MPPSAGIMYTRRPVRAISEATGERMGPGPWFEFLALQKREYWERAGRLQRVVGIKPEYFHRADALRVRDDVMQRLAPHFSAANESFNYFGPTEFEGRQLTNLLAELETELAGGIGVSNKGEVVDAMRAVCDLAGAALADGKVLLVLG